MTLVRVKAPAFPAAALTHVIDVLPLSGRLAGEEESYDCAAPSIDSVGELDFRTHALDASGPEAALTTSIEVPTTVLNKSKQQAAPA